MMGEMLALFSLLWVDEHESSDVQIASYRRAHVREWSPSFHSVVLEEAKRNRRMYGKQEGGVGLIAQSKPASAIRTTFLSCQYFHDMEKITFDCSDPRRKL